MIEIPLRCKPTAFIAASIMASALIVLTGCKERTTTASVTGVNYTDETIAGFQVIQPDDFDNRSPTQEAMAYGAGGQMCCYALPYHWREGLKVRLKVEPDLISENASDYYAEYAQRRDTGTLYYNVEVPVSQYAPGKAQLLWIQFLPHQQHRAIATDLDPTNPDFPSDTKGWPVPSVAFRHKLWEVEVDRVHSMVKVSSSTLNEMNEGNDDYWKNQWDYWSKTNEIKTGDFYGFQDKNFRKFMREMIVSNLKYSEERLGALLKIEPK